MNNSAVIQFVIVAITAGTPMVFVAVGELLAQRSGVMNLGLEGMMLLGAVVAYAVTVSTHSTWLGLLAGAAAGMALAALHAVLTISLRANQIVSGIALVILGTGLSQLIGSSGENPLTTRSSGGAFGPLLHGGPADWPIVGPILFGQDLLVYLSWVFVAGAAFYLLRTRAGLWLRAVGEDPASADAAGISVARTRYLHVLLGGAAAGVGGAYLTLALFNAWQDNLSAGQGWIAFAIVIFCGWRPVRALAAAYLFGALTGIGFKLQLFHVPIPAQILSMLPFAATLVALLVVSTRRFRRLSAQPASLGEPYWRESR
ncbi:MAG TPA: ABC transporter permease [Conexibacter sp.]|nr:ABC transporter permease [Conexibacter sp.]